MSLSTRVTTFAKVQSYKKFIQKTLIESAALTKDQILRGLLLKHLKVTDAAGNPALFGGYAAGIKTFIRQLENNFEIDTFTLVNIFLEKNIISKSDELFPLLVAYFYYFEDSYSNINDNEALRTQILIPLHLHRQNLEKEAVARLLAFVDMQVDGVGSPQAFLVTNACAALGFIGMADSEQRAAAIARLIERLEPNYLYMTHKYAMNSLLAMDLTEEELCSIIDNMLVKADGSEIEEKMACKMFEKMPIPASRIHQVTNKLLEIFDRPNDYYAGSHDPDDYPRFSAVCALAMLEIPSDLQQTVVDKLVANINNKEKYFRRFCTMALSKIPMPRAMRETVITNLLTRISSDISLRKKADAIESLVAMNMSGENLERFIDKLIELYHANIEDEEKEIILQALTKCSIPLTRSEAVSAILNVDISRAAVYIIRMKLCKNLADWEFVVDEVFRAYSEQNLPIWTYCEILTSTVIPVEVLTKVVATLLDEMGKPTFKNDNLKYILDIFIKHQLPISLRDQAIEVICDKVFNEKNSYSEWEKGCKALMQNPILPDVCLRVIDFLIPKLDSIQPDRYCRFITYVANMLNPDVISMLIVRLDLLKEYLKNPSAEPYITALTQQLQSQHSLAATFDARAIPPEKVQEFCFARHSM